MRVSVDLSRQSNWEGWGILFEGIMSGKNENKCASNLVIIIDEKLLGCLQSDIIVYQDLITCLRNIVL